jgi:hypothetical protein
MGPNLFGDDLLSGRGDASLGIGLGDVDLDADLDGDTGPKLGDMDDDWIIDDIGGGAMNDGLNGGGGEKGGYVKEMGGCSVCFLGRSRCWLIEFLYGVQLVLQRHNRHSNQARHRWRIVSGILVCVSLSMGWLRS